MADEDDRFPDGAAQLAAGAQPLVVIACRRAAAAVMPLLAPGTGLVDADLPLQAQLRSVDHALRDRSNGADSAALVGVRSWIRDLTRLAALTERELDVLDLIMCGNSAATVARRLFVTVTTVRAHIRSILAKLEVSSQLAAAAVACQLRCAPGHRRCQSRQF